MSNNKFCTECGSGIEDTSKFCTKCGSQQSKETNQPSTREIADEMIKAQKKEEQKKQFNKSLANLITLLVVIVIGIIIAITQSSSDSASIPCPKSTDGSAIETVFSYSKFNNPYFYNRDKTGPIEIIGGCKVTINVTVTPDPSTRVHTGNLVLQLIGLNTSDFHEMELDYPKSSLDTTTRKLFTFPTGKLKKDTYSIIGIGTGSKWTVEVFEERK